MSGCLVFIGLGLFDEKDITIKGLETVRKCDVIFAEFYTSVLFGTTIKKLEKQINCKIILLNREDVENEKIIIEKAKNGKVAFLTAGDPMTATTHISLRLKAIELGIQTRIIHNASIFTTAASVCGLQHYKFGRIASIPFITEKYKPNAFYEILAENKKCGFHTLILLDLKPDENRFMYANEGMKLLLDIENKNRKGVFTEETLVCVVAQLGSDRPIVRAGYVNKLIEESFGPPLHSIIVPGSLHFMEEEALKRIAGWNG